MLVLYGRDYRARRFTLYRFGRDESRLHSKYYGFLLFFLFPFNQTAFDLGFKPPLGGRIKLGPGQ